MDNLKLTWKTITLFVIVIVAAISFTISGAYVVKNEEETQLLEEEDVWDILNPDFSVNYSLREHHPFQFHEIHVLSVDSDSNNTYLPWNDDYTGIYVQVNDGNSQQLTPNTIDPLSSYTFLSYYCDTRNFSIEVTQMSSIYVFTFDVMLYSYYRDASATLWYLFGGFIGIWAVCIVLLFVFRRQKDQVKAK